MAETLKNTSPTGKTTEQENHDKIKHIATQKIICLELESLLEYGKSISQDTYNNCIIDAYVELRDANQLK